MKYQTLIELRVDAPVEALDALTDRLADALYDLHDVTDPDLGAALALGRLDVSMVVEADTLEAATAKAVTATRAAIHAIGGSTPGWEDLIHEIGAQAKALVGA
ncbi:MAG: hypothetical protein IRZ08_17520 [Frankia sp.]|nr:hypothetical protein [Frankia sp.]